MSMMLLLSLVPLMLAMLDPVFALLITFASHATLVLVHMLLPLLIPLKTESLGDVVGMETPSSEIFALVTLLLLPLSHSLLISVFARFALLLHASLLQMLLLLALGLSVATGEDGGARGEAVIEVDFGCFVFFLALRLFMTGAIGCAASYSEIL